MPSSSQSGGAFRLDEHRYRAEDSRRRPRANAHLERLGSDIHSAGRIEVMSQPICVPFLVLYGLCLGAPAVVVREPSTALLPDIKDKCETFGLFPAPHIVCSSNGCSQACVDNATVTTNNGHTGTACSCPPATGVACCTVAYVSSINDYELVGACAGASCPTGTCTLHTVTDGEPPEPVERWGACN